MSRIKGTQTEKNLLKSFAGESQARNRYTFAASVAEKEGLPLVAEIFLETAENERVHAKTMFSFLEGGMLEITATYPAGIISSTDLNLEAAAAGEHEEHTILYPGFAKIAEEEGLRDVAGMYRFIAKVEANHEKRYNTLLANLKASKIYKKEVATKWICRKCGHIHEGIEAPNLCPLCKHEKKWFSVYTESWL